ncbi:LysR family transcriptional regulator [Pantoea sp. 18069]|uniref:LysR family transcriptional regulator n=1 Tax=Pantoea sp. 18069 TaxID=2681415 RepID=UPI001357C2F5|nr:LysR family transcriptional regulator [Pantoea sp. 18069]
MRFDKLDLNLLVVLDALLTTRSVTRAAERVFLSQPATSLSLKRLREYFKDELLQPIGKSFVLTPLAAELAKPVHDVLLRVQAISRAQPTFDPATSQRRFVIDSSDYVISVLLSEMVRRATSVAPRMEFDLRTRSPQSRELLQAGDIELLITPQFAMVPGHPSELLFEDTFSCLVSPGHFGSHTQLTAEQYFDASHIGVEWGGGQRLTYDQRLIAVGKRARRQDVIAPSFTIVPHLLVGTPRIATLPTRLARQIAARFPLRVVECPVEIPPFAEHMQWHKYQERDPAMAWLRALLIEVAQEMEPRAG